MTFEEVMDLIESIFRWIVTGVTFVGVMVFAIVAAYWMGWI